MKHTHTHRYHTQLSRVITKRFLKYNYIHTIWPSGMANWWVSITALRLLIWYRAPKTRFNQTEHTGEHLGRGVLLVLLHNLGKFQASVTQGPISLNVSIAPQLNFSYSCYKNLRMVRQFCCSCMSKHLLRSDYSKAKFPYRSHCEKNIFSEMSHW